MSTTNPCFDCDIIGDNVQCSNVESGYHQKIPVEDIIAVLPRKGEHTHNHTMLFLRQEAGKPHGVRKVETIRLNSALPAVLSRHLITEIPNHLSHLSNNHLRVHVVISSASGTGTAKTHFLNFIQPLLAWIGLSPYDVHETESVRYIIDLCHSLFIPQAEIGTPQTIILLSGDGGLCDIIDSFHGTSKNIRTLPNIALIPAGTGNAMASSTGLAADPKAALMALLFGKPKVLPAFVARFSQGARYAPNNQALCPTAHNSHGLRIYGGVVASWGIHAALVADSDTVEYRKFGADRFKMAAKELLFPADGSETHKYNGTITLIKTQGNGGIEQKEIAGNNEHMYVLGTLVSNLEKDFMISPQSAPTDGTLRIIRFGPMSSQRAMQLLSAAYQRGQHVQHDDVMYTAIDGFRIDFHEFDERWRRVCIDGRVVVVDRGGWVEVRKDMRSLVKLLLPGIEATDP